MSEDLSAPDPRNWMRPGRTRLDEVCAGAKDALQQAGAKILVAPRSPHSLGRPECDCVAPRPHGERGVWFGRGPALLPDPDHAPTGGAAGRPDVPHP